MRVVHISSSDLAGGAARAAYRLHQTLVERGEQSQMLVRAKRSLDPSVTALGHPDSVVAKVKSRCVDAAVRHDAKRYAASMPGGYDGVSDDRAGACDRLLHMLPDCDVIHLHWVKGLVDWRRFFARVPGQVSIVWTLHDMNPLTGGCHFDHQCGRWRDSCGACPQLGSVDAGDLSAQIWRRKRHAYQHVRADRMRVVAPSRWLAEMARESPLLGGFEVDAIPNGIDTDAFAPRDRGVARATLGLPADAKVVAFVAHGLHGRRKGFELLRQSLARLGEFPNVHLLSAGAMHELSEVAVPHVNAGPISNERMLSLVYSAADVFVIPSIQDNLPNTVLEAMACGTPVVGFSTGGIPEMVEDGRTGWLVPVGDVAALSRAVMIALEDPNRDEVGRNARTVAVERYDSQVQAAAYSKLYQSLTKARCAPHLPTQALPAGYIA